MLKSGGNSIEAAFVVDLPQVGSDPDLDIIPVYLKPWADIRSAIYRVKLGVGVGSDDWVILFSRP